jgi:DNA/RNA-binding domain of Phe-tRNA-synthetase-like protein
LKVIIDYTVSQKFPDLKVLARAVRSVRVSEVNLELEEFKLGIVADIKRRFSLESLKDEPVFRAYRSFFWRVGVDPTKIRPAAEALIRRVLAGRSIPRINTAVDAYNIASMTTSVALAAFDISRLAGDIIMRFGNAGENFLGIGMDKPMTLAGGEIVMADASRLIAVYPHRDAGYSRITLHTQNSILISCGVPGLSLDQLREALDRACDLVMRFCGGEVEGVEY